MEHNIIVLTETWLRNKSDKVIHNSEIMCSKFQIYRRDRVDKEGGGVLISVSALLYSEEIILNNDQNIEFIAVCVNIKFRKIFVTCSYIPPASNIQIYEQHANAIKFIANQSKPGDSIIVLGDFNIPNIKWCKTPDSCFLSPSVRSETSVELIDAIADLGLFQINNVVNKFGKLLDLVFVDQPEEFNIFRINPLLKPEDVYHPTLEISIDVETKPSVRSSVNQEMVFDFTKADYSKLNHLLCSENWFEYIPYNNICPRNIDTILNKFYDGLFKCFKKSIPMTRKKTAHGPPWNTKQLNSLKNLKNKQYRKFKKSGLSIDYMKYSISRSVYNSENIRCYNNYLFKVKRNFKNNPKSFYQFVNSKRRVSGYPSMMKFGDKVSSNDADICDMFAAFFSSAYSDKKLHQHSNYPYPIPDASLINCPTLDKSMIMTAIQNLKYSVNSGPDGVPSCVLINCLNSLLSPITYLFNISIVNGYFLAVWRESYIIPLFKSGSRSNISNYRGIVKLSVIPKLFEKLVTEILSHQVVCYISPFQHGFKKGCSTTTNLLEFTTSVITAFDSGLQTDTIYTDFSKAFDKVNHDLLLFKLNKLGFSPVFLKWISTYLKNRYQCVLFRECKSKNISVLSGVPQGSHLGPLLFLIFINDLPSCIKNSRILMYADDVKLFHSFTDSYQRSLLQSDLDNLYDWCIINLMDLNLRKCKHMMFYRRSPVLCRYKINEYELESVDEFLDLGVLLDCKLSFNSHVIQIVNKAKGVLGFLKRWGKEFNDPYVSKHLFTSLVRPILEYASVVWDPQYEVHVKKIESVQKQFLLFCLRNLPWNPNINLPSYKSRLQLIDLPSLENRRKYMNIKFVINLVNGSINSEFLLRKIEFAVPIRSSRNFIPLKIKYFRTNYANFDPMRYTCNQFNIFYPYIDFSVNPIRIKRSILNLLNNNIV